MKTQNQTKNHSLKLNILAILGFMFVAILSGDGNGRVFNSGNPLDSKSESESELKKIISIKQ